MSRRAKQQEQQQLVPTIQRVVLSQREREALRRKSDDYYSRHRAGWDPLELRLALRAQFKRQRPGYAISNPLYDALLRRVGADIDDSLPGMAWLRSIYGRHAMICTLPGVRERLRDRWDRDWRHQVSSRAARTPAVPAPAQGDLFEAATGARA
jgi:hypothetical protein